MSNQELVKRIARNAIVLALYVALTFIAFPISFGSLTFQFRISEILVLLCFFNRDYVIGITLGCFLSNIASPFMPWDLLIGTAATLISSLAMSCVKHLGIACLFPIIANSFLIGIEYHYIAENPLPYWYSVGVIALGETVVIIIGYILFMLFMKKEKMQEIINAKLNKDFKW